SVPPTRPGRVGEGGTGPSSCGTGPTSAAWHAYLRERWSPWAERDRVLQQAQRIYTDLFRVYQSQQRLGEAYEVVLGLGHLSWRTPSGHVVARHVVVAQANVRFDADRGVISV